MNKQQKYLYDFIIIAFLFSATIIFYTLNNLNNKIVKQDVKGVDTENINVQAIVQPSLIEFTTHPEKRIPLTNNWDTITQFRILDCNSKQVLFEFNNINTNNIGTGTIYVDQNTNIPGGLYAFSVKGYSHLNKIFDCQTIDTAGEFYNFVPEGELLAGDTSIIVDNYINSLDISNTVNNLYTSDTKNDLNQDSKVNSLDVSNQVLNLFKKGD